MSRIHQSSRVSMVAVMSLALLLVATMAYPAFAIKPLLPLLCKAYGLNSEEKTCRACHTYDESKKEKPGEKNVNLFGKELKRHPALAKLELDDIKEFTPAQEKAIIQALKDIARYDSDGDGASNIEELNLDSNPGLATKKPDDAELAKYRKEHPDQTPIAKPAGSNSDKKGKKKKED